MDSCKEAKETLKIINNALPNIQSYLCNVLKREKLSLEAEALRARYEAMLTSLEKTADGYMLLQPSLPPSHRHSVGNPDRINMLTRGNTLPSPRRRTDSEMQSLRHSSMDMLNTIMEKPLSNADMIGALLWQDDHQRWHKRHSKLVVSQKSLSIYESVEETNPVLVIPLSGASFVASPSECDKDLSFAIRAQTGDVMILDPTNSNTQYRLHTFAAFSELDLNKWQKAIDTAVSWEASNSSLNKDLSGDDALPLMHGRLPEPLPVHDSDEGNLSDCTIYEDIDELVQEFDKTMQATAQAMSEISPKKPKKKRRRTFFSNSPNHKALSQRKTQLEEGDHLTGYLYKRTGSSSWKKKWCQLKGCIFSYGKSSSDTHLHEHILLRAEVSIVKDAKKPHAFRLACKGVREVFFAADNENDLTEWITRLQNASKRSDDLSGLVDDSGVEEGDSLPEGIYNVPRNMLRGDRAATLDHQMFVGGIPMARGIYDVPRSFMESSQTITGADGTGFQLSGRPFDIYDVPRSAMVNSPDEDNIYDYPVDFDPGDMEIYDYPPDALTDILPASRDSNSSNDLVGDNDSSHSHTPGSADGTISSTGSCRQSGSLGSSEDVSAAASFFGDGYRSLPHTKSEEVESFISSISRGRAETVIDQTITVQNMPIQQFGQAVIKGNLLRKERVKWNQCYCLIRNSFLECHKNVASSKGKPLLKLLLLGSQVSQLQDSKKQWAFQVKHPRRDGVLMFAAENEYDFKQWTEAFRNASSIQVQQVDTMEDIRISDSDLKKRWKSAEDDNEQMKDNEERLHMSKPTAIDSKRGKSQSMFKKKASRKDKKQPDFFHVPNDTDGDQNMKRSVSMELITRPTNENSTPFGPQIASRAHRAISPDGIPCFQGYLRIKASKEEKWSRLWCLYEDLAIKCYTSQRNLTIVNQTSLRGCTIARADTEAKRKFTFRVWNIETTEAHYFSATEEEEYQSWMTEITKGAVKQTAGGNTNETNIVYYYPKNYQPPAVQKQQHSMAPPLSIKQNDPQKLSPSTTKPILQIPGVTHHGPLKKRTEKGTWNIRYCRLRESCLYVYYTGSDQTPITVLAVKHCKVESIKLPPEETTEEYTFTVAVRGGKTHMFAAEDEKSIETWLKVLQDCIQNGSPRLRADSAKSNHSSPLLSTSSPRQQHNTINMIPATSLVEAKNAGYCEILQTRGAWTRSWCVLQQNCLYVYQNKESRSPIRTLSMQGYTIEHVPAQTKEFTISLHHTNNPTVLMATSSQMDMMKWFDCLDSASKSATTIEATATETITIKPVDKTEVTSTIELPVVTTTTQSPAVTEQKNTEEVTKTIGELNGISEMTGIAKDDADLLPELGEGPLSATDYKDKCKIVISHFEKRIKKTRKVAQQTENSLKIQRQQLSGLKEKFLEHIERLKNAPSETETAQKKMMDMETKLTQIGKILPYLEKYIVANRQAEMQTLAILKEGCTVKLQELENRFRKRSGSVKLSEPLSGKLERRMSMPCDMGSPKSKKSKKGGEKKKDKQSSLQEEVETSVEVSLTEVTRKASEPKDMIHQPKEKFIEEPAYAVVGHKLHTHKREPSLPEHYVQLELNQNTNSDIHTQPQTDGIHYSTIDVNQKNKSPKMDHSGNNVINSQLHTDRVQYSTLEMKPKNNSLQVSARDSEPKPTSLNTEANITVQKDMTNISSQSFTQNDNVNEKTTETLNTSSETHLTALDTVIEEDLSAHCSTSRTSPTVITPYVFSEPCNSDIELFPTSDESLLASVLAASSLTGTSSNTSLPPSSSFSSTISPILTSQSSISPPPHMSQPSNPSPPHMSQPSNPPPPPMLQPSNPSPPHMSQPSISPPPLISPPPSISPPPPPLMSQLFNPSPSPPPSNPSVSIPSPPPPPPPSLTPISSSVAEEASDLNSQTLPLSTLNRHPSPDWNQNVLSDSPPSTIPSRPPPPPVMKKSKSIPQGRYSSPTNTGTTTTPTVTISKGQPTPPPVKAKPKRPRSSTLSNEISTVDKTSLKSNTVTTEGLSTIAQRMKAFQ